VLVDDAAVAALPSTLATVPDVQARAVLWVSLVDGTCLGRVDPRVVVETFGSAWPHEVNDSILNRIAATVLGRLIPTFLPDDRHDWAKGVVAEAAATLLDGAPARSTRALLGARTLARSSADEDLLRDWAAGKNLPEGLDGDSDFRWLVVRNLAGHGWVTADEIAAFRAQDDTLQGRMGSLTALAALPTAEAKEWAWRELATNRERSNYELNALAQGFWHGPTEVLRPYVPRYFVDVPALTAWVGEDAVARVATLAYPARVVEQRTADLSAKALARTDLTPGVRRPIVDADSQLHEALRSRATFG
jgi:aminopeptidase N